MTDDKGKAISPLEEEEYSSEDIYDSVGEVRNTETPLKDGETYLDKEKEYLDINPNNGTVHDIARMELIKITPNYENTWLETSENHVLNYITKPEIIDAVKISADNISGVAVWCGGEEHSTVYSEHDARDDKLWVKVPSIKGTFNAHVGDWLCKNGSGRFFVVEDEEFKSLYYLNTGPQQGETPET